MLIHMVSSDRVQRVLAAAAELSREERTELIAELVLRLEGEVEADSDYDDAWSNEIARRVDDVISGRSHGIPLQALQEVLDEIRGELRRRRAT